MARCGILRRERYSTRAHLARLNESWRFLSSLRLIEWTGPISGWLHLFAVAVLLASGAMVAHPLRAAAMLVIVALSAAAVWWPVVRGQLPMRLGLVVGITGLFGLGGIVSPLVAGRLNVLWEASFCYSLFLGHRSR
jgi:hypothetical protein